MQSAVPRDGEGNVGDVIAALVAADGTAAHLYADPSGRSLLNASLANLADAAHYLCMLHGRHPGVIDHAATRTADNAARSWLLQAADAFTAERSLLTQVAVAVGPLPSTAGQDQCDATVLQQRHALDMLAQSDRRGCAMGAAIALVIDWGAVRKILETAALRVGLEPRPSMLPTHAVTLSVADALGSDEASARALQFGARQLLGQHRGLWDLLSARASIRAHA
ncbi:DUF6975 family protein [Sphingobium algorifonticola]|uniref:Uncharacterized protein n=1 Tax=Sphingobium algorifonticola TaxID=2008318 RepID=A0A437JB96_9SPHN|nr:hypothetical protein [Sphingobium algorifonticola]RVT43141.1 hypothetical protein ENE74_00410 [Sphingobium algorifonticola]